MKTPSSTTDRLGVGRHTALGGGRRAADELARRLGVELLPVVGEGGKSIARPALQKVAERLEVGATTVRFDLLPPVEALVGSAEKLTVMLGSRGLHGFRALGSVSERVAHGAACSVLVTHAKATR